MLKLIKIFQCELFLFYDFIKWEKVKKVRTTHLASATKSFSTTHWECNFRVYLYVHIIYLVECCLLSFFFLYWKRKEQTNRNISNKTSIASGEQRGALLNRRIAHWMMFNHALNDYYEKTLHSMRYLQKISIKYEGTPQLLIS